MPAANVEKQCPSCGAHSRGDVCPHDGTALVSDAPPALPDRLVGRLIDRRYRITGVLGAGAMGTVYRAEHVQMGRAIALKVLHPDLVSQRAVAERFRLEAHAASRIESPNVATIFDCGEAEGELSFLAMQLVEGPSLAQVLDEQGPLELGPACGVALGIARALCAAHAVGVVHRDLKPDNVVLSGERGEPKVIDFGIARLLQSERVERLERRVTHERVLLGTPIYMSPEAAKHESVGPPTDLYALGVILFEMLAGRPPFDDPSAVLVLGMHIVDDPEPLSAAAGGSIPPAIDALVASLLAKEPGARPSAAEVARILEPFAAPPAPLVIARAAEPRPPREQSPTAAEPRSTPPVAPGELRRVTVAVFRFEALEAEAASAEQVIAAAQQALRDEVERAGGRVAHALFGVAVATWGTERARADDPVAALETAFNVVHRAATAGGFAARATVVSGRAETGEERPPELVARSERIGEHGARGVYADERTYRAGAPWFEGVRCEGGFRILSAVGRDAGDRRLFGVDVPLVGRLRERRRMWAALDRTLEEARPGLCIVAGDTGLGKTRLLYEHEQQVLADERLFFILRGSAPPRAERRLGLVRALLLGRARLESTMSDEERASALLAGLRKLSPELPEEDAQLLLALLDLPPPGGLGHLAPEEADRRMRRAFVRLLVEAARTSPVLVLIDDLQWADEDAVGFLADVLEHGQGPIHLVCATTPDGLRRHAWLASAANRRQEILLAPLEPRAVGEIVDAVLARPAPAALHALFARVVHGNPRFVEEYLHLLHDQGLLVSTADGLELRSAQGTLPLPVGVELAVQQRLDLLPPELRRTLVHASVVGVTFWDAAVRALGVDDPEPALARLVHRELLERRARSALPGAVEYTFRQAVVADVCRASLPAGVRRALHARLAAWALGEPALAESVAAFHFEQAGDTEAAAVSRLRAARRALELHVPAEASEHALCARDLAGAGPVAFEAALVLDEALRRLEKRDARLVAIEEAEAMSKLDDASRWRLAIRRLEALYDLDDLARASECLRAMRWDVADDDPAEQVRLRCAAAVLLHRLGELDEAELHAADAVAAAAGSGQPRLEAVALQRVAGVARALGDFARWHSLLGRAIEQATRAADRELALTLRANRTDAAALLGRVDASVEEASAVAEEVGDDLRWATQAALTNAGLALRAWGRGEEAVALLVRARKGAVRAGNRRAEAWARWALADLALGTEEGEREAESVCDDLAEYARATGNLEQAVLAAYLEGRRLARVPDADGAKTALASAVALLDSVPVPEVDLSVRLALAAQNEASGDDEAARRVIATALEVLAQRASRIAAGADRATFLAIPCHVELLGRALAHDVRTPEVLRSSKRERAR